MGNWLKNIYIFSMLFVAACLVGCGEAALEKKLPADTAAFGAAHFGMTDTVFRKTLKGDTNIVIENSLFKLEPHFIPTDHRLYALRIISPERTRFNYDDLLITDMNTLVGCMVHLYGGPARYFNRPKTEDLRSNEIEWYCLWNFANKEIRIGIAQQAQKRDFYYNGDKYIAVCQIVNKPLKQVANQSLIYLDTNPSL